MGYYPLPATFLVEVLKASATPLPALGLLHDMAGESAGGWMMSTPFLAM